MLATTPGTQKSLWIRTVLVLLGLIPVILFIIPFFGGAKTSAAARPLDTPTDTSTPSPPFTDIGAPLQGINSGAAVWGDYNNDGNLDMLLAGYTGGGNYTTKLYRNNGSFVEAPVSVERTMYGSLAWGDYNNDGGLDVLVTGVSGSHIYRNPNDGSGAFIDIGASLDNVSNSSAVWGDYNNDGRLDVLLSGYAGGQSITRIYRNDGSDTFTDSGISLPGVRYGSVAWGDYDRDGRLDILLTGQDSTGTAISRIYRNNGDGTFTDIGAGLQGVSNSSVAWGDYNNDGYLDLVLTGSSTSLVYRNNGDGTFTDIGAGLQGVSNGSVAWGDYNNDGYLDIILTGSGSSFVYRNNGDGTFTDIGAGLQGGSSSSAAWGDYNNDGYLDILLTGQYGSSMTEVYRNNGTTSNSPPNRPGNLRASLSGTSATLTWGPSSDDHTPQNGLTYNLRVGTTPGGSQVMSPMANSGGDRQIPALGNANHDTSWTISNLAPGTTYFWSVQAIDTSFAGSAFATEGAFTTAGQGGTPTATPACGPAWRGVSSPNTGTGNNHLNGVAALAPGDIWAVGYYTDTTGSQALAMHWTGTQWNTVPVVNPGTDNVLNAVAARSANDVWAVGYYSSGVGQTLVEHWNGRQWTVVPSANQGTGYNVLNGLAIVSDTEVWAVGYYRDVSSNQTLTEHWINNQWTVVPSPNVGTRHNYLTAVAALSSNEVWAVGYYWPGGASYLTLTLRWTGTQWNVVSSPNGGPGNNMLYAVSARATNDVWAVGTGGGPSIRGTLILHWTGLSWSVEPSPSIGNTLNSLNGVTALSDSDAWAAGSYVSSSGSVDTLAEHWDGTQWQVSLSPNLATGDNGFYGISAGGQDDVWAVGSYYDGGGERTLVERYNDPCGSAGTPSVTPTPSPTGTQGTPLVTATSSITETPSGTPPTATPTGTATPCVGSYTVSTGADIIVPGTVDIGNHCNDCLSPLGMPFPVHLYGRTYSAANASSNGNLQFLTNNPSYTNACTLPNSSLGPVLLPHWDDLDTRPDNPIRQCPSCGIFTATTGIAPNRTFNIEWRAVDNIYANSFVNFEVRLYEGRDDFDFIYGQVTGGGASSTVGIQGELGAYTLVECNTAGSLTAGLRVRFAPLPCGSTPTPTATSCPMNFSDVHSSDYFYEAVSYLFCEGAISGYSDGTFRPYNNTTRGQLCKIVVNAEGWAINTQGGPHFTDVPSSNAFYTFIETAYNRNIISGYGCGTGCLEFRPNANITRAQLSKVIVNAQRWTFNTQGGPHFTDVAEGSPFYEYVETAFNKSVISGYSCGLNCLEFRPGNNATRGQISKIVFNAVTAP